MGRFKLKQKDIENAREYCLEHHAGQTRIGNGEPYSIHPLAVAETLANYGYDDPVTQIVALLHDVGEDCGVKMEEIDNLFGYEISNGIFLLSKNKGKMRGGGKLTSQGYIQRLFWARNKVKRVKIADMIDNTKDLEVLNPSGIERKIKDAENFYIPWGRKIAKVMVEELATNIESYKVANIEGYVAG